MEALLTNWDGETLITRFDQPTGAWVFIAIHSTRLGPAMGGARMQTYADPQLALQDALRLATSMTYKFAVAGLPCGGSQAVIAPPHGLDPERRTGLLRRYGALVGQLGGLFQTGLDMGISPADMDVIAETGAPYVLCRSPLTGGAGDTGSATALGVFCCIEATCEQLFDSPALSRRRVLVQGAGNVGGRLIERLCAAGAEVLFSDVDEDASRTVYDMFGLRAVPADQVYDIPCDIFAPCSVGGILNRETIPRLRCRAVVGAANNQLAEPSDAERLHAHGILYAPDYVVNVGGAVAIIGIEALGWTRAEAEEHILATGRTLRDVYALAAQQRITTDAAGRQIVRERLGRAAQL